MHTSTTKTPSPSLPTKIIRYATASCVLGKLCATESRAEIVMINVGSGTNGFNINQMNGGLSAGQVTKRTDFPIPGGGNLYLLYKYKPTTSNITGLGGNTGMALAINQPGPSPTPASVKKFTAGTSIGITSDFNTNYTNTAFKADGVTAGNFTTNDYVGFRFGNDLTSTYYYGWLQTTWDGTNFQINSGAYESTANTAILAGAVPVPEPGTLALGSLALLASGGAAVRRYRKQRQSKSANSTDATNPVTPIA